MYKRRYPAAGPQEMTAWLKFSCWDLEWMFLIGQPSNTEKALSHNTNRFQNLASSNVRLNATAQIFHNVELVLLRNLSDRNHFQFCQLLCAFVLALLRCFKMKSISDFHM